MMGLNSLLEAVYLLHRDRLGTSNPSIDPCAQPKAVSACASLLVRADFRSSNVYDSAFD